MKVRPRDDAAFYETSFHGWVLNHSIISVVLGHSGIWMDLLHLYTVS